MSDRDIQNLAFGAFECESGVIAFGADVDRPAYKAEGLISQKGSREKAAFAQHLEAIADPKDDPTSLSELNDGFHDRRKPGDGARPEVVAVRKSAWKNDRVYFTDGFILVPDEPCVMAEYVLGRMVRVMVAV